MLTFALSAAAATAMNRSSTLGGIESPSEKKITALRPGMFRMLDTTAIKPFAVEYPRWSRSRVSKVCSMRDCIAAICISTCAPAMAPAACPAPGPPPAAACSAPDAAEPAAACRAASRSRSSRVPLNWEVARFANPSSALRTASRSRVYPWYGMIDRSSPNTPTIRSARTLPSV
jgi:hypothetical protein